MPRPTESDEWLEELFTQWTDVYKKSMTTLMLLRVIHGNPWASADTIGPDFTSRTGWALSERALYRTLRRLASNGLLDTHEEPAPKTGAKKKKYSLTKIGTEYLSRIEEQAAFVNQSGGDS